MEVDGLLFLFRKSGDFIPKALLLLSLGGRFEGRREQTRLDLLPGFSNRFHGSPAAQPVYPGAIGDPMNPGPHAGQLPILREGFPDSLKGVLRQICSIRVGGDLSTVVGEDPSIMGLQ
jgi:hypothetical protein